MDLSSILAALRASWWMPVATMLAGGLLGLLLSLATTPTYTSSTRLFISVSGDNSTAALSQGSTFSQDRVASYAQLLQSEGLAARVVDDLDLRLTPRSLAEQLSASVVSNTVLLDVAVTDTSPDRARDIARSVGTEFAEMVQELETPDGQANSPVKVTVVAPPDLPTGRSAPRTARNVAAGALLGLVAGLGLAVARVHLDRTVKDPTEAAERAGVPVIGTVIRDDGVGSRHVFDRQTPTRVAEDYRQLRTNLQFLNVDDPPKVIMVASAMPAEGKTTAAINLGLALAEAGRQVTILDADLRRPRVTSYLGMVGGVGLTNILAGTAVMTDVMQPYADTGVSVIGAGPTPPNPSELLASKHMLALIDELRGKSEYVLIDAPPLLPVADSTGLAVMVDGILLSVRYGKSRKDQLEQAAATLERVGARTLGVILNIVPPKAGITAAYGYGYSYAETAPESKQRRGRRRAS
ncbi:polysaccharide biosynthesis tyrosine autokinase [Blastococcus sp. CT_GayMR16]|uniref:polysaccharide biosynthesis tyrosine autokinase n=1 Tax=Blastococcus sp. CT_GayMR16 TaxID=2559607 RepID=UPI0010738BDC|nr:polysaccharide biosynthesis tyrosine autokinase [Blastococcus sp. CT_GayMR16]TFV90359.1 polysaccharide biosynthesis tyrosine autokinase [Blastococcus sp. CT_GayMR16]